MPNPLSFRDLARSRVKQTVKAKLREATPIKSVETFTSASFDGMENAITLPSLGVYSNNDNTTLSAIFDRTGPFFGAKMSFSSDGNYLFIPAPSISFEKFGEQTFLDNTGIGEPILDSIYLNLLQHKTTGAVLIFKRFENTFKHIQTLSAYDPSPLERFGSSFDYDENSGILAVGGPCIDSVAYGGIGQMRTAFMVGGNSRAPTISKIVPRSTGKTYIYKLSSDNFHFVQRLSGHQGTDFKYGLGLFGGDVRFKNGLLDIAQYNYSYDPDFEVEKNGSNRFGFKPSDYSNIDDNVITSRDGFSRVFSYKQTLSDGKFQYVKKTPNNDVYNLLNERIRLSGYEFAGPGQSNIMPYNILTGPPMIYNGNTLFLQRMTRWGLWNGALAIGIPDTLTMTKSSNGEFNFLGGTTNPDYNFAMGSFMANSSVYRNIDTYLRSSDLSYGLAGLNSLARKPMLLDPFIDERTFFIDNPRGDINPLLTNSLETIQNKGQLRGGSYFYERGLQNGYSNILNIDDNLYGEDTSRKINSSYSVSPNLARYLGNSQILCFSPDKKYLVLGNTRTPAGTPGSFNFNYVEVFKKVNGKFTYQTTIYNDLLQQFYNNFSDGLLYGDCFSFQGKTPFVTISNKLPNGTRKLYIGNDVIRTYTLTEVDNREKIQKNNLKVPHYFTTSSIVYNISSNEAGNFMNGEGPGGLSTNPTLNLNVYANYDFIINSNKNFSIRKNINDTSSLEDLYGNDTVNGISNEKIMWTPKLPGTYYYVDPLNLSTNGKIIVTGSSDNSLLYSDWNGEKLTLSEYSNLGSTPPAPHKINDFIHDYNFTLPQYLIDQADKSTKSQQQTKY